MYFILKIQIFNSTILIKKMIDNLRVSKNEEIKLKILAWNSCGIKVLVYVPLDSVAGLSINE